MPKPSLLTSDQDKDTRRDTRQDTKWKYEQIAASIWVDKCPQRNWRVDESSIRRHEKAIVKGTGVLDSHLRETCVMGNTTDTRQGPGLTAQ